MKCMLDIPYGGDDNESRRLDLLLPDGDAHGGAILFIHGGGWRGGDKTGWRPVMEYFCRRGYACASANYRLAPTHRFPAQVEDVRLAMAYLKGRAGALGFDADRIAAFGSSAGGHLAAMLATIDDNDDLGAAPELTRRDTRPAAAVYLCTVFSLHHDPDRLTEARLQFLGATEQENPQLIRQASPIDRITNAHPPCIMVVGDQDATTPPDTHEAMEAALRGAGVRAERIILPNVGHGYGYGVTTDAQKITLAHVDRFLAAELIDGR